MDSLGLSRSRIRHPWPVRLEAGGLVQAQTWSPASIFGTHVRYVVPLFQRPYVWTEADQWQPLWDDIRTVTEQVLDAPPAVFGAPGVSPHFLGAIVLEQQQIPSGFIAVRHVVDGQQRLTTLQLMLDAAQLVVQRHGAPMDAQALRVLVLNDAAIAQHPDDVFKVWPTDRDQDAFRAAMDDDAEIPTPLAGTRIVNAHRFFVQQITEWADPDGDSAAVQRKLNALVRTLREHLRLVVIDLEQGDNAQVIFETLNHRGSRLLAADLVKNLVFQIAKTQQSDVEYLYRTYWQQLDSDYWRQPITQGRRVRPRIDAFLSHWLTMTLLREIPGDRVFTAFRDHVTTAPTAIPALLATLSNDAQVYARLENLPTDSTAGRFHYRVIRALDSAVTSPLLLWLLRWDTTRLSAQQRDRAITALESWLVRRALVRATAKDVNRTIVDLLRALDRDGPESAGDSVETFLAGQRAESRYWPTDAEVSQVLDETPIYQTLTRPRLRMVLEALEDAYRSPLGEGQSCPRNLTVEHVMPQAWRDHWPLAEHSEPVALDRDRQVHTLGNLTLVTGKLNPALSNRPWTDTDSATNGFGGQGKRSYLLQHSQLKLNAQLVAENEVEWSVAAIRDRGRRLAHKVCQIWPRPSTAADSPPTALPAPVATSTVHTAAPDPDADSASEAPGYEGKYRTLWQWLRSQEPHDIKLTFADIEDILGIPLPPSARVHLPHWYGYNGTALGRAIRDAGWKVRHVDLETQQLTFVPHERG